MDSSKPFESPQPTKESAAAPERIMITHRWYCALFTRPFLAPTYISTPACHILFLAALNIQETIVVTLKPQECHTHRDAAIESARHKSAPNEASALDRTHLFSKVRQDHAMGRMACHRSEGCFRLTPIDLVSARNPFGTAPRLQTSQFHSSSY